MVNLVNLVNLVNPTTRVYFRGLNCCIIGFVENNWLIPPVGFFCGLSCIRNKIKEKNIFFYKLAFWECLGFKN